MGTSDILPVWKKGKAKYNNHHFFDNNYRMLISGSSGDGKSVILLRLLLTEMLDYDVIFLNTPSIDQKEYQIFIEAINRGLHPSAILGIFDKQDKIACEKMAIDMLARELKCKQTKIIVPSKDVESIESPENLAKTARDKFRALHRELPDDYIPKVIIVADDAIAYKQQAIDKIFSYCRTQSQNCIYLVQDFFAASKKQCRSNASAWIFFKQSDSELKMIFRRVNKEKQKFEEFEEICRKAWAVLHGFILITRDKRGTKYTSSEEVIAEIRKREQELYPTS